MWLGASAPTWLRSCRTVGVCTPAPNPHHRSGTVSRHIAAPWPDPPANIFREVEPNLRTPNNLTPSPGAPSLKGVQEAQPPAARRTGCDIVVIRLLGDQRLGRQDPGGDGSSVADSAVADLYRVDDASFDHVDGFSATRVKAMAVTGFRNLDDGSCAVAAAIGDDAGERVTQRTLHQCRPLLGGALQLLDQTRRVPAQRASGRRRRPARFPLRSPRASH